MALSSKLLVVDDNPDFLAFVHYSLQDEFYDIHTATRIPEAEAILHSVRPQVILLDVVLGQENGLDWMLSIRADWPEVLFIVITAHNHVDLAIKALQRGAFDYLDKPVQVQLLRTVLRRCFDRVHLEAENRRRAEALQLSEERLQDLLHTISDHIYVTMLKVDADPENIYISPNVSDLTGYPADHFQSAWDFWPKQVIFPDDRELAARQWARLQRGRDSETEYRLLTADDRVVWVRDSARVRQRDNALMIYGVVSDITERKELEDRFFQSQKMDALGQLASGVAHDFGNMITVINGCCELIFRRMEEDDVNHRYVSEIHQAGQQAARLVRQLLGFSRRQQVAPQTLDLNAVAADLDAMLVRLIGENIALNLDLCEEPCWVRGTGGQFEQILVNLVVNARDAMPGGGQITVKTRQVSLQEYTYQNNLVPDGIYVLLSVADTGCGMDVETQRRIFEPFFTTKQKGQGTGLGLATVHNIVTQCGGHIRVTSQRDQGTTFKIYLPLQLDSTTALPDAPAPEAGNTVNEGRIMVVEDENQVRLLAAGLLRRQGYQVVEATNGQDALTVCDTLTQPLDLLLTDIVMPGLSGPALAQQLQKQFPHLEVLFMSGYTETNLLLPDHLLTPRHFLEKPFEPDELLAAVHTLLANGRTRTTGA